MTQPPSLLTRRSLLGYTGSAATALLVGTGTASASEAFAAARPRRDPFTLGVASGDPRSDGVVLWTRLAPHPLEVDGHGGMSARPVTVEYEVATSSAFATVVRRGSVLATRELGHSVHPEITGLDPDRQYWYRFRVGSQDRAVFRHRRATAFRAMYENLPLRLAQLPDGSHIRMHRRLPYGTLADLTVLDTRQYRSNPPCEVDSSAARGRRLDPHQTMLGGRQGGWLFDGWSSSAAQWQLPANQLPMARFDLDPSPRRAEVYLAVHAAMLSHQRAPDGAIPPVAWITCGPARRR